MASTDEPSARDGDPRAPAEGWRELPEGEAHSWGNVSERHWSRARAGANREAIEHMRERSRAPGVAGGGGPRNHYCPKCRGVIPFPPPREPAPERCPHCGATLEARVREMFNWVEIDEAPKGDAGPLVRIALAGLGLLGLAALIAWWLFA